MSSPGALRTPLYDRHVDLGGQMVEFGGWMMPLQYSSMREEHVAVRERVGLFDVSHMGEFGVDHPNAASVLQEIVTNDVPSLLTGQARYNIICNQAGGIVDDCLVYRDGDTRWTVVVNAGTRVKDLEHFRSVSAGRVDFVDMTMDIALLAVQGPRAVELLQEHADIDLAAVPYYHFKRGRLGDIALSFSRTGYTGEDGFELFVSAGRAVELWDRVLEWGQAYEILPCGLGARDTLRLEASMRLSGQDIWEDTNPLEAGLGWAVKLDKGNFVGRDALAAARAAGLGRSMVGLELDGRAIARHGYSVLDGGREVGEVTSGTFSFTLGKAVAMAYVETASRDSAALEVEVRGTRVGARRVPMPFYKRNKEA